MLKGGQTVVILNWSIVKSEYTDLYLVAYNKRDK
jgi:hypothetical protein